MTTAFSLGPTLNHAIYHLQQEATSWNRSTFGNIQHNIKRTTARLEGIQRFPHYPYSDSLLNLETDLMRELDTLLSFEKKLWHAKSRIQWLQDDDAYTRFFQTTTLNRRRRNRINFLKDDCDSGFDNPSSIKDHILSLFTNPYTIEQSQTPFASHETNNLTTNTAHMREAFDSPLRDSEVLTALHSFKAIKAPGPDSIHPIFYQKY